MPIHPSLRRLYPGNWRAIGLAIRRRAGDRCEICGVPDCAWGWRDAAGAFHQVDQEQLLRDEPGRRTPFRLQLPDEGEVTVREIILTVAHLDHRPDHNDPANLQALCQRCHLNHDRPHHRRSRTTRQHEAMATPELLPIEEAA